ncbi:MAG: flagellar basal body L-ring protein FlgH [Panacagrimonas sp.]
MGCGSGAVALFALSLLVSACAGAPRTAETAAPAPVVRELPPPTAGAIYNAGSSFALFEDPKARAPGDLLTVLLVEKTQAKKNAATSTSKESSADIGNPTLFGRPLTMGGTEVGVFGIEGSREFSGKGDTSQSNQLNGSVTVTVIERLPNGNLVVSGEKNLALNQGSERVRLSGIVRPVDVRPDNTLTSDRVADARIEYVGRGALADANSQGWLARFFNSPYFPF